MPDTSSLCTLLCFIMRFTAVLDDNAYSVCHSVPFLLMYVGGQDFDNRVMEHFIKLFKKKKGMDIRKDQRAVQKLRREVEKAKRALSSAHQTRIEIEAFYDGEDFSETLTRARFEELNMVSSPLEDFFSAGLFPVVLCPFVFLLDIF